jgi:hypothetical protein
MPQEVPNFRVFLSSPGDVLEERKLAMKIIEELPYRPVFRDRVSFRIVAWDRPGADTPMKATTTPQEAINQGLPMPSECDIVIGILWSRIGTKFIHSDGKEYASGTYWELLDAIESGVPQTIIYKRTSKPLIEETDSEFESKTEQYNQVEQFFKSEIFYDEAGRILRGINNYASSEEFGQKFETHLEALVVELLAKNQAKATDKIALEDDTAIFLDVGVLKDVNSSKNKVSDLTLTYRADTSGAEIRIYPELPYLNKLANGEPIAGLEFVNNPFYWGLPSLDLKLVNNSTRTIFLTKAIFSITESMLNPEPVLVIHDNFRNTFRFKLLNEGWGSIRQCVVRFNIVNLQTSADFAQALLYSKHIGDFEDEFNVDIADILETLGVDTSPPDRHALWFGQADESLEAIAAKPFGGDQQVCVYGEIQFIADTLVQPNQSYSIRFSTQVAIVHPGVGMSLGPTFAYNVKFDVARTNYEVIVPISQYIKPNDVDRFTISIGVEKSSRHIFDVKFEYGQKQRLVSPPITLDVFIPKSSSLRLEDATLQGGDR